MMHVLEQAVVHLEAYARFLEGDAQTDEAQSVEDVCQQLRDVVYGAAEETATPEAEVVEDATPEAQE